MGLDGGTKNDVLTRSLGIKSKISEMLLTLRTSLASRFLETLQIW